MMFADQKSLRGFLKLPVKTPSRERLDAWLAQLDPKKQEGEVASMDATELQITGFGPECHTAID